MDAVQFIEAPDARMSILAVVRHETVYVDADCSEHPKPSCRRGGPYVPLAAQGPSTDDNITFDPTFDEDRLQHPGLMGQMVDVPSDRLALPKVAAHPRPHAARTIGAPCINITSGVKLMWSIRSAKEHWLGKI